MFKYAGASLDHVLKSPSVNKQMLLDAKPYISSPKGRVTYLNRTLEERH